MQKRVNEGLFRSAYEKYKSKVLSYLGRFGIDTTDVHRVESYIRDFFEDKFDELDCAKAIREEIMFESTKRKYQVELNEKEYSVLKKVLGQLNEDTDDWDMEDMPAGMSDKERYRAVVDHVCAHGRLSSRVEDAATVGYDEWLDDVFDEYDSLIDTYESDEDEYSGDDLRFINKNDMVASFGEVEMHEIYQNYKSDPGSAASYIFDLVLNDA